jgi:hypothetical protein
MAAMVFLFLLGVFVSAGALGLVYVFEQSIKNQKRKES